jgi:zinc transport system substrate-binding protein
MGRKPKTLATYAFALILAVAFYAGCRKQEDPWKEVPGGPTKVLVTIPPLYCFAKNVAGDDAAVLCLLGTQGPHDYEPTHTDALKARKANLFVSVGLGLDEFTEKIVNSSGNKKLEVVELGEKALELKNLLLATEEHEEHPSKEEKDGHHHHGDHDPHVWLGIDQAKEMVGYLSTTFQKIDPANKANYEKRAKAYTADLEKLKEQGLNDLKAKKNKKLIATHDSLRYFAKSFGLEIVGSIQPRPGIEAGGRKLADLVKLCKEKDVRVIVIEPQYPATNAEKLKEHLQGKGITVELVTIDPLETVAPAQLDENTYVKTMRENVKRLAEKLP